MKIGKLRLDGNLILAPMSSVTNLPFRLLCKKYGASLVYSEMTFSEAILRQNEKSLERSCSCLEERPLGIQLLGSNKETLVGSARIIIEKCSPDLVDLNLGCPSRRIMENDCGAALLKRPEVIADIISGISGSIGVPVTAKIRILNSLDETIKISRMIEKAGASALTVHGRTQKQQYSGKSNLEFIKNVKKELTIPVIANGDIRDEKTARHVLEYTQCDGLMIGRAAIGNPYIFRRIEHYLKSGELLPPRSLTEKLADFFEYELSCRRYGLLDCGNLMSRAMWFTRGIKNAKTVRMEINRARDINSILGIMKKLGD